MVAESKHFVARKLQAYAQFGVTNYCVDPAQHTLEAFELHNGLYQNNELYRSVAAHEEGENFWPASFPELQINLTELFAA